MHSPCCAGTPSGGMRVAVCESGQAVHSCCHRIRRKTEASPISGLMMPAAAGLIWPGNRHLSKRQPCMPQTAKQASPGSGSMKPVTRPYWPWPPDCFL